MDRLACTAGVNLPITRLPQCPENFDRQTLLLLTLPGADRAEARARVRAVLAKIAARLSHRIIETPCGPEFADSGHHISISYASGNALIGISKQRRIGVDIVKIEPISESSALARLYLPDGASCIGSDEAFAARWASLEACCKALKLPLAEIDPARATAYAQCEMVQCEQIPGYRIALAVV